MDRNRVRRICLFLIGGLTNTALTYGLYRLLERGMAYQYAYAAAYVLGVLCSYWYNATLVFRVPLSWRGLGTYPLVYVLQYSASALLLQVLVVFAWVPKEYAPLAVTGLMVPLTYASSKLLLSWSASRRRHDR